jgi:hypothetical protein
MWSASSTPTDRIASRCVRLPRMASLDATTPAAKMMIIAPLAAKMAQAPGKRKPRRSCPFRLSFPASNKPRLCPNFVPGPVWFLVGRRGF